MELRFPDFVLCTRYTQTREIRKVPQSLLFPNFLSDFSTPTKMLILLLPWLDEQLSDKENINQIGGLTWPNLPKC